MNDKTKSFLEVCKNVGYTAVGIDYTSPYIPASNSWHSSKGNVFAFPETKGKDKNGMHQWPHIWKICEDFNISWGCGNSDQHQIKSNHGLSPGVYLLASDEWYEINVKKDCIDIHDFPGEDFPHGSIVPKCGMCVFKHQSNLLGYMNCSETFKKLSHIYLGVN